MVLLTPSSDFSVNKYDVLQTDYLSLRDSACKGRDTFLERQKLQKALNIQVRHTLSKGIESRSKETRP